MVSTQADAQSVPPLGHWQTPATQDCAAGQAVPQVPQLVPLVVVSTQLPLQRVSPTEQPKRHVLASQACPTGQAVPQAPQFPALLVMSTHAPLHSVWPGGQPQKPPRRFQYRTRGNDDRS
jgi:hypothetical protein